MKFSYNVICVCLLYGCFNIVCLGLNQRLLIEIWADKLGNELWNLGKAVTNRHHIEHNYQTVNIESKNPRKIISEIVGNVSIMMKKKMEAVKCIIDKAERSAEMFELGNETDTDEFQYYRSNRPTEVYDDPENPDPDENMYLNMILDNDTHFFNLAVNTTHSSVHVPTNIYHKHYEPRIAIEWSDVLDDVFQQNYKADPALFWQYFGSSSGTLRHYPAMNWGNNDKGLFDCRIQTWFIEAATCTKDVAILLDNSGSMEGMNKHIATLVVNTILDTLSNNDYINIITYEEKVDYLVPCFEDIIVQATEENIIVFKDALKLLKPTNKSILNDALVTAFDLLYQYREKRDCHENSKYCNQAIMVISDGIASNISDIIDKYNRMDNGTSIPIRIFTFLVGKEASHLEESMEIACNNRGYHSHVASLEQVTASVNKYVLVFARPLVLQALEHPLSWTHAYSDQTFQLGDHSKNRFENYRLLTSVAGPAFDLKESLSNKTKTAILLGVAGTDVPLEEISKLMYPYKTGVNSHSFIVSNNGYVVKHPDLRPMFEGILKDNYNSIDLSEVEQMDDDLGPREVGPILQDLRTALVQGERGVLHDLKLKYHYDDMRRVSREVNDYYFAPIEDTPFSVGFAMPDLYGNYSIEVGDEIELHRFSTINISSFFNGTNWKIHPTWVYCKHHYLEGHEFDTPESEFVHFVNRMNTDNFKWSMQYEVHAKHRSYVQASCGAKTLGDHDYYCDKNLVQRLVFDAKNTKTAYDEKWMPQNDAEDKLRTMYNVSIRFVATMSGLTRWEYITPQENLTSTFGDLYPRSIDEIWYKSAVIQHRYSNESFVYTVPFEYDSEDDLLVTGSFPIFPVKDDISAPAAVVGLQFSHKQLQKRFFEITSATLCRDCLLCGQDLECYVVDSSGYIIISNNTSETGKFFGDIDGCVMEALWRRNIFEKVVVRDYQALCYFEQWVTDSGNALLTWILSQIIWLFIKINVNFLWDHNEILGNTLKRMISKSDYPDLNLQTISCILAITTPAPYRKKCQKNCNEQEEAWHTQHKIPIYKRKHTPCEKERDLYILRQATFTEKQSIRFNSTFHKPFYIKSIPHSNLLLISIKANYKINCIYSHTTDIRDIVYSNQTMFPCQKLYLNDLVRRRLQGCFNENPLEKEIKACGKSALVKVNLILLILLYTLIQI